MGGCWLTPTEESGRHLATGHHEEEDGAEEHGGGDGQDGELPPGDEEDVLGLRFTVHGGDDGHGVGVGLLTPRPEDDLEARRRSGRSGSLPGHQSEKPVVQLLRVPTAAGAMAGEDPAEPAGSGQPLE